MNTPIFTDSTTLYRTNDSAVRGLNGYIGRLLWSRNQEQQWFG